MLGANGGVLGCRVGGSSTADKIRGNSISGAEGMGHGEGPCAGDCECPQPAPCAQPAPETPAQVVDNGGHIRFIHSMQHDPRITDRARCSMANLAALLD